MSYSSKVYEWSEVEYLSARKRIDILKEEWGCRSGVFEVWGELSLSHKGNFGTLENVYAIESNTLLFYPLTSKPERASFYMKFSEAQRFLKDNKNVFIRCLLIPSPEEERTRHQNPLEMQVKLDSGILLKKLPDDVRREIITAENFSKLIPASIYNFYHEDVKKKLAESQIEASEFLEKVKQKRVQASKTINELEKSAAHLEVQKEQASAKLLDIEKSCSQIETQHTHNLEVQKEQASAKLLDIEKACSLLKKQHTQLEIEMNKKIERLKEYMSEKAKFLQTFEFVDQDDLDSFLSTQNDGATKLDGVSFKDVLNGDYKKAVSYIQAYLVEKGVLYPRHIIENYITLLRSQDLIVLAGDSGSGKTNLVKSFANAVGGKAKVVPVKPNWTSSEDLLGYYNPLERKFLKSPFLSALLEAQQEPEIPYFICLDEMNLARVEYYFADFLSLLETRTDTPEITLYADDETAHVLSELKAVVKIISDTQKKYSKEGVVDFIKLMQDDEISAQIRKSFGFSDQNSLIKYHNDIRRMLSAVMTTPSTIKLPSNVFIIGTINIDETTHYLSPKILDRAHVMRFDSPLLSDWDEIEEEVKGYGFDDVSNPLLFDIEALSIRQDYPRFDRQSEFCTLFTELNREFFHKLGIDFGMRTIRQGLNYIELFSDVNESYEIGVNNFLLHKVLPKFTFDGNKTLGSLNKLDLLDKIFSERIKEILPNHEEFLDEFSSVLALEGVIENAKANDGIVNYWS